MTLLVVASVIETASTLFVFHKYNSDFDEVLGYTHRSATVLLLNRTFHKLKPKVPFVKKSSIPSPFRIPDSLHGYRLSPGSFEITYRKLEHDSIYKFKHYVTINEDGTRFTGTKPASAKTDVYVFGDSFIFGEGVNDEQTFTYLLQSRFPDMRFHLVASPGYSLSNTYLSFKKLSSRIGPDDIIIMGHANFYEVRQVAAPSRVKWTGEPKTSFFTMPDPSNYQQVRVRMVSDSLVFDMIPYFCAYMGNYCQGEDPSKGYMDSVTALLINGIARRTDARLYLLHFDGSIRTDGTIHPELVAMLDKKVRLINASKNRFDYLFMDDIEGFDPHPGPYWHHTMFRVLSDSLCNYKNPAAWEGPSPKSIDIE